MLQYFQFKFLSTFKYNIFFRIFTKAKKKLITHHKQLL